MLIAIVFGDSVKDLKTFSASVVLPPFGPPPWAGRIRSPFFIAGSQ